MDAHLTKSQLENKQEVQEVIERVLNNYEAIAERVLDQLSTEFKHCILGAFSKPLQSPIVPSTY